MNFDAEVNNQIFRKDWPVILALNAHLATILPVRLKYSTSDFVAGQVLGADTASPPIYDRYSSVSGSQTAKCILLDTISSDQFLSPTGTALGRGVFGGEVYYAQCTDLSSGAISDLNGSTFTDATNVKIFKF